MGAARVRRDPPPRIGVVRDVALAQALVLLVRHVVEDGEVLVSARTGSAVKQHEPPRHWMNSPIRRQLTPMKDTRGSAYSLCCPGLRGVARAYDAAPPVALRLRCMSEMGIEMKVSAPSGWHGASGVSGLLVVRPKRSGVTHETVISSTTEQQMRGTGQHHLRRSYCETQTYLHQREGVACHQLLRTRGKLTSIGPVGGEHARHGANADRLDEVGGALDCPLAGGPTAWSYYVSLPSLGAP